MPDSRALRMTRRSLLALGVTAIPAVAACGALFPTPTPTPARVSWSNWAVDLGSKARLEEQRLAYEAATPNTTLDIQNTPSAEYMPKLLASLAADQGPDVIRMNTEQLPIFVGRGQTVDLEPLFNKLGGDAWIKRSDVKRGAVDRFRLGKGLAALPYGGDMDALFYNRTLFEADGLSLPPVGYDDPEWSYDRVLDLATKLTKRRPDGGATQLGIDVGGYRFEGHVENAGGSWFTADGKQFAGHQPPAAAAIDWLAGLRLKHGVAAAPGTEDARTLGFVSGRLAMSWSGVSQVSNRAQDIGTRFDWDVAPVPRWGSNPRVVKSGFSALILNAKSKQVDRAWHFLHWVTGPVGSLPDVETGWSLPVFGSLDQRYFARFVGRARNLVPALDGPRFPSQFPMWTNPNYAEAWRRIHQALDVVFLGKGPAAEVMGAARPEIDAILQKPSA